MITCVRILDIESLPVPSCSFLSQSTKAVYILLHARGFREHTHSTCVLVFQQTQVYHKGTEIPTIVTPTIHPCPAVGGDTKGSRGHKQ